jgi:hypothetical protein
MSVTSNARHVDLEADRLLREAAESVGPIETPVPLDYGRRQPRHESLASAVNAGVGFLGGWRQVGWAIGFASVLGGLGLCLARSYAQTDGAGWMAFGGLALGLLVPVPARRDDGAGGDA